VWWVLFSVLALRRMGRPEAGGRVAGAGGLRGARTAVAASLGELLGAARELRRLPGTARYLVSFLLFNDAIQAVVALSSVYLTHELYVAQGRPAEDATQFLLLLILMIQAVAVVGALAFGRLAGSSARSVRCSSRWSAGSAS
jgi:UMF1 family MFS transporter